MPPDAGDVARRLGRGIQPLDAAVAALLGDARGEGQRRAVVGPVERSRRRAGRRSPAPAPLPRHRRRGSAACPSRRHAGRRSATPSGDSRGAESAVPRVRRRGVPSGRSTRHSCPTARLAARSGRDVAKTANEPSGAMSGPADRDELLDVCGAHAHSPANELVSPTSRVLSSRDRVDGGPGDLGGELADVVELAGRLAARRDRTGVGPLEERRGDRALDHVARDDDEPDAALLERRESARAGRPRRRAWTARPARTRASSAWCG